ncbi:MAG: polyribonucleotide nucleotidyltransferase [Pseudomonadota bacterium]|nr:polyribonucleotide nucleotidyltransferase [Pseudomonadota bacterium]
MTPASTSFNYGSHTVTIETNKLAKQATAAVTVTMGETIVLVTLCASKQADPTKDFLPLTVQFQEKLYAYGKIPGGYFRREGRPTERETLISRLIDRPLRPLFDKSVTNEIQIIATLISSDPEVSPDVPALIGASAAIMLSGLPFNGPVGAARIGYVDEKCVILAKEPEVGESKLDLFVSGTKNAVLMVESEAQQLSTDTMLEAVFVGHSAMQETIDALEKFAKEFGKTKWNIESPSLVTAEMKENIQNYIAEDIKSAYLTTDKQKRYEKLDTVRSEARAKFHVDGDELLNSQINQTLSSIEKQHVRSSILTTKNRIDGRDLSTVRPINIDVSYLPRSHGSAVFTRGETQALVATTLGSSRDAQEIEVGAETIKDNFMLHYNFPPYSVGEVGFVGSPKRREIGHGKLAKRAISPVIPSQDDFPYVLRVVSEITESNGSSSMATVCGTSLALMDEGVPLQAPVAGIAMGLIKEGDDFAVLTDILGDEDHLGDMDFKVAGTKSGITALQMDIKIEGISKEIMSKALAQASDGITHILSCMNDVLSAPRENVSKYAPSYISFNINSSKIREVIGRGGATIKEITEKFSVSIDIEDSGLIKISATDSIAGNKAKDYILNLVADVEVGNVFEGKIMKIMDFGAFVSLIPGKDGFLHISQISKERVYDIHDVLKEGEMVKVKVVEIDRQGRIRVSKKELEQEQE